MKLYLIFIIESPYVLVLDDFDILYRLIILSAITVKFVFGDGKVIWGQFSNPRPISKFQFIILTSSYTLHHSKPSPYKLVNLPVRASLLGLILILHSKNLDCDTRQHCWNLSRVLNYQFMKHPIFPWIIIHKVWLIRQIKRSFPLWVSISICHALHFCWQFHGKW